MDSSADCGLTLTQCDLKKESCSQCIRAGISCFGYRDPNGLIIHDESLKTQQRVVSTFETYTATTPIHLDLAQDVRARMAFFSFDVSGLSQSHGALASLLVQGSPDKHLTESVDAVSLAFMAHHNRQLPFDRLARAKYIEAIRQINKVLKSPHLATADTTLQSVLLLDLYEKLVNRDQLDASAWIAHVNGAVALVKARGTRNVSSHTARQLAWRLITMTIIGCAVVSMRILDALLELRQNFRPFYLENDNKWRIAELCFNLVDLKADISEGRLITKTDILGAGWALESRFAAMQEELLLSW